MGSRWALGGMKQVGPRGCGDGRVVARTPGACGSAGRSGEEEEGCGSRGLGLPGPQMGRRWRRGGVPPAERVGAKGPVNRVRVFHPPLVSPRPWWTILRMCPWILATKRNWRFGKPRSGMLGLGTGQASPELQMHSFTFIHSECIEHLVCARHGAMDTPWTDQTRSCPPGACSLGGRGLTNIERANKDINKIINVRRVGKKINRMMKEKVIGGGQLP